MDFTLTDDERAVLDAAAQVAAGPDPWAALAGGGWLDIVLEEGPRLPYLGLVAEALGAAGVSVPLVGTAAVWPTLFGASAGARRVGVAELSLDVSSRQAGENVHWADGGALLCEDGVGADVVVVLGDGWAGAHESFTVEPVGGLDGDGLARITVHGSPVAPGPGAPRRPDPALAAGPGGAGTAGDRTCTDPGLVAEARRRAAALAAAEMAGAIERISAMTTAYVAERHQFGRPLSAFQVVAHGAARLAVLAQAATWSARLACASPDPADTHAAKGWISSASAEASALAHQLHGAVGFTEEYGLQRLTKRLRTLRFSWGADGDHHLALGRLA